MAEGAQKKFTAGNPFFGRRPLNSSERRKVEVLLKRAEHLERRVHANPHKSMSYDWQELSALRRIRERMELVEVAAR